MLLVDHDQPEIGIGQEQRGACADDDAHAARRHRIPRARAQALRELRVPLRRAHAKAFRETVEKLRGESDLGDEDQRLLSAPDDLGNRLKIDARLPRPGDAVEQRDVITAARHCLAQRVRRLALRRREIGQRKIRVRRTRHGLGRQHQALQRPLID